MSVIVNVCSSDFSIMVSDNRLVRFDDSGTIEVVSENYRKIHRINENVLIGFTGDAVHCQNIFDKITKNNVQRLTLEQTKNIVKSELNKNKVNELGIRIIISGRQSNGNFITYAIDSNNDFDEILYEPNKSWCLIYAVPKPCNNSHNYGKIIESAIHDNKFSSSDELIKIIGKAIFGISKLNSTVNNTISYEVLH